MRWTAVVIACVVLTGCGGGTRKPVPTVTARAADPCSMLDAAAVRTALGAAASPVAQGPATCTYTAGPRSVQVQTAPATAQTRAAFDTARKAKGAVDVSGPGYTGYAQPVNQFNGQTSRQALAAVAKGDTAITITVTYPKSSRQSVVDRAVALGHAAGG